MAGTAPKYSKTVRQDIKRHLAWMDRRGYLQVEMCEELARMDLPLSQGMVSQYLKQIREEYKKQMVVDREMLVGEKIQQYRDIRRAAWEAYDRSKQDATKIVETSQAVVVRNGEDPAGALQSAERLQRIVTVEGRLPQNAYLVTIMQTLEAERDLLGLDTPKEVKGGSHVSVTTNIINVEQLTRSFKEQSLLEARQLVERALPQGGTVQVNGFKEPTPGLNGHVADDRNGGNDSG